MDADAGLILAAGIAQHGRVLLTVGHGTAGQDELLRMLTGMGVERVVDVRSAPGSRAHPHVAREALQQWLSAAGVAYRWEPRLGGFRRPAPDSPDTYWRNPSFRGYAGHLRTPDAAAALAELAADVTAARTAVMCSESVWWRCHRRLIADTFVLARSIRAVHILPGGRLADHVPPPGVRVAAPGLLVYDRG